MHGLVTDATKHNPFGISLPQEIDLRPAGENEGTRERSKKAGTDYASLGLKDVREGPGLVNGPELARVSLALWRCFALPDTEMSNY